MFPVIHIIETSSWYKSLPNLSSLDLRYYVGRVWLVLLMGILAAVIPKFGLFINFIGAFSGTAVVIVIPVLMYERVFKDEIGLGQWIVNRGILAIGFLFGGLSTVVSLYSLITEIF